MEETHLLSEHLNGVFTEHYDIPAQSESVDPQYPLGHLHGNSFGQLLVNKHFTLQYPSGQRLKPFSHIFI